MELRDQLQGYIAGFEQVLARQRSRQIRHYRTFLEEILEQIENYDPFETAMRFPEYEETDEDEWEEDSEETEENIEEDDIFGGNGRWTS